MVVVVVPFPFLSLTAQKPWDSAYPTEFRTIGDHIKKKRLELDLIQKDLGKILATSTSTITNWEKGHTKPMIGMMPAIISFLGYVPLEMGDSLSEKLLLYRILSGFFKQ